MNTVIIQSYGKYQNTRVFPEYLSVKYCMWIYCTLEELFSSFPVPALMPSLPVMELSRDSGRIWEAGGLSEACRIPASLLEGGEPH